MHEASVEAIQSYFWLIGIAFFGPIIAHILYGIFSKSRPMLALVLISGVTMGWMIVAATISYGPPFGAYGKTVMTGYVIVATLFLWLAHHQLIKRSNLKPHWLFHISVIAMFGMFSMALYIYHIAPRMPLST